MSPWSLIPCSLLILCQPAAAQRIVVVDGLNRPGAHFTDLPAAEAAAQDGDILQVHSDGGVYTAIQTSKALTITATIGQATIRVTATQPFQVTGLPANRTFALKSCLLVNAAHGGPTLLVSNCQGNVHLDQLEISGGQPCLDVAWSVVTVKESRMLGGTPGLAARSSILALNGVSIQGSGGDSRFAQQAAPAVTLDTCFSASLAACQLSGGLGDQSVPAAPALTLRSSAVDIGSGGATASLRAGPPRTGSFPVPAVTGQASVVRLDPAVVVAATNGAPAFQGVSVTSAAFPSLRGSGIRYLHLTHASVPGAAEITVYGLAGPPLSGAAFSGALWIDPRILLAEPGVPTYLPLAGAPYGMTAAAQVLSVSGGRFELSNPVAITVR